MKIGTWADTGRLMEAARGRQACDLTIENVQLVNTITGEIYPAAVDILDGIIVRVRTEEDADREAEGKREEGGQQKAARIIDGEGRFLVPGLIDTHLHIESTMMTPSHFAEVVAPWGTTTIVADPHEIANVMGIEGVRFMLEDSEDSPVRQYFLAPSCVPASPQVESAGAEFGPEEIGQLLKMPRILGLGEIMNYRQVCEGQPRMMEIIEEGKKHAAFLQGHAPRLVGPDLAAYILAGPVSDHECRSARECREKARLGMHVNLKASSLSNHLKEALEGIKDQRWKDRVSLCTDDVHAATVLADGHLNRVVRMAIEYGADPLDAYRFATYNAAQEYGFADLGAVAPGFVADLQLLDRLDGGRPFLVLSAGREVAREGHCLKASGRSRRRPANTLTLPELRAEDFRFPVPEGKDVEIFTIYSKQLGPFNGGGYEKLPAEGGYLKLDGDPDLALLRVQNRYGNNKVSMAPIRNFGITKGAVASTVAHDCHNLLTIYRSPEDARIAAEALRQCGGGIAAAAGGELIALLPLPVGGLMSDAPVAELAQAIRRTEQAVGELCSGSSLLKMATFALSALPGAILTDQGIIWDCAETFTPLFRSGKNK